MKKQWLSLFLAMVMISLALFSLSACFGEQEPPAEPGVGTTYVNLNINPEISLIVDAAGLVVSAVGENEDAQVLLYGESGIVGADVETATEKIVKLAIDMGFLSEDNTGVEVLVSAEDDAFGQRLFDKINATATATAKTGGISLCVSTEGAYTLLCELEAFRAAHPDDPKIAALSVADYKLALSASKSGEIALEAAVALEAAALIQMAAESYADIEEYQTVAFLEAKAAAEAIFEKASYMVLDGVYAQFYAQNAASHLMSAHLGVLYQLYAMGSHGFDAIADTVAYAETFEGYALDSDTVQALASAFGLEGEAQKQLEDSAGKVSVESVEAFVDIYFKNLPAGTDVTAAKETIASALTAAKEASGAEMLKITNAYKTEIDSALAAMEPYVRSYEQILSQMFFLSEEEKTELMAAYHEAMLQIETVKNGEAPDSASLRAIADKLAEGMEATLRKINADLSKGEKAAVEAMKTSLTAALEAQRQQFSTRIEQAAEASRSHLRQLKDAYLGEPRA